ncbi:MAG TPA: hypothetical protein PKW15_07690, partial [Alphaproteobacteria bacterium]|nr:hypothetical protein [Alphaproteobacteria bacterium]
QELADEEEKLNDGKRKRPTDPQEIAREIFCDENAITFGNNGALIIKVGDDFHFFGADPNGWSEGFNQMIRLLQDRGSDPWAALIIAEGPAYFREWFRGECRKQSARWAGENGYDEAFLIYGDLVPMVANQNIQMLAKGYWAEKVFMCDEHGEILMETVKDIHGNEVQRARMTVIIMHDPDVCNAAGVPQPKTHIKNFSGTAPKRHDDPNVYQAFSYRQQASRLLRKVHIPLKDDGTNNNPQRSFDAARLYESQMWDLNEAEKLVHNGDLAEDEGYDREGRPRMHDAGPPKLDRKPLVNDRPTSPPPPYSKVHDADYQEKFIAEQRAAGVPDHVIQQRLGAITGAEPPEGQTVPTATQQAPVTPAAQDNNQQPQPPPVKPEHHYTANEIVFELAKAGGEAGDFAALRKELKTGEAALEVIAAVFRLEREVDDSSSFTLHHEDGKILEGIVNFSATVDAHLDDAINFGTSEGDDIHLNAPEEAARKAINQLERLSEYNDQYKGAKMAEGLSEIAEKIALDLERYHEANPAEVEALIKKEAEAHPVIKPLLEEMKAGRGAFTKKEII